MVATTRISQLSAIIAEKTAVVNEYLNSHHLPTPSFEANGPETIPIPPHEKEIIAAQDEVIASTLELHNLMKGPTEMLVGISAMNPNDVLSLQAVYRYDIASTFALDEEATFEEISAKCKLNKVDLKRLLRHAMTNHIFQERDGKVVHTAASKVLKESSLMRDIVGNLIEEMGIGAVRTVDALVKYGQARTPNESGFSLAHNGRGFYEELVQHPERRRRFAGAMSKSDEITPLEPIKKGADWAAFSTVVDVGGGWGTFSVVLAESFPNLRFTVQDFEHVVADGPANVPQSLKDRISFMPYSFLNEQVVKGADVYLFCHVFHNFPDGAVVDILRNQIPALKKGAHIVVQDEIVSDPPKLLPPYKEKHRRSMDLVMLTLFGARERTLNDWVNVFKEASPNFEVSFVEPVDDASDNILDVVWKG